MVVNRKNSGSSAFTLLEMSIVLIIIGLIVGGLLVGKSMIRNAALQSIVTDVFAYQQAIAAFEQKYNALPGDMANATSYWGTNPNCATGGAGTGTQTCNGNGDGGIGEQGSPLIYEEFTMWQHLANAAMIQGSYSGVPATGGTAYNCSTGNCPGGRVSQSQFYTMVEYPGGGWSSSDWWVLPAGNYLAVGAPCSSTGQWDGCGFITPQEAYLLDKKVDDGLPGSGTWMSFAPNWHNSYVKNCVVNSGTNAMLADGTTASAAVAVYNPTDNNYDCAFLILPNGKY